MVTVAPSRTMLWGQEAAAAGAVSAGGTGAAASCDSTGSDRQAHSSSRPARRALVGRAGADADPFMELLADRQVVLMYAGPRIAIRHVLSTEATSAGARP